MNANEFGLYIKSERKKAKLTLTELGDLIGYSNPYLSQIETGKKGIPSPELLKKLSEGLDVDYTELLVKAGHLPPMYGEVKAKVSANASLTVTPLNLFDLLSEDRNINYKNKLLSNEDKEKIIIFVEKILLK